MRVADSRYKVKQFILYVIARMAEAERLGSVKLNKVLYRADHEAYRQLGRKITSYRYQKNKLGPTLTAFLHVTEEMEAEGLMRWESRPVGRKAENRPVATGEPDLDVFSREEIAIID